MTTRIGPAILSLLLAAAALTAGGRQRRRGGERLRRVLLAGLVAIAAAASTACSARAACASPPGAEPIPKDAGVPAAESLHLIVVSDGSTDSLLLEWTGAPAHVTRWQYRRTTWNQEKSVQNPWGDWTYVPGSEASTRCHRLTGLSSSTGHRFEVRAVSGTSEGEASNRAHGITHTPGEHPQMNPGNIVEGDGRTEWEVHALRFVITIPDGVRMEAGGAMIDGGPGWQTAIPLYLHHAYGDGWGGLLLSRDGWVFKRYVAPPAPGVAHSAAAARDVAVLLDQIVASVRVLE